MVGVALEGSKDVMHKATSSATDVQIAIGKELSGNGKVVVTILGRGLAGPNPDLGPEPETLTLT